MALEITRGLFGLEIPDSSDQDFKDAVTMAQLSPDQAVRASGMMSGSMLGRGIAGLGRAAIGQFTGADVRTPDEKRQAAQVKVVARLKEAGIDPGDPAGYLPIVAQVFQEEGLVEDALKAATALQGLQTQKSKLGVEQLKAQADWLKAKTDATKEIREGSVDEKIKELAKTGKYTPASLAAYAKSGNISDLQTIPGWTQVETSEGVFVLPEGMAAADAVAAKVKVGDTTKGLEGRNQTAQREKLQILLGENLKPGEQIEEMLLRLEQENPVLRSEIYGLAKQAYGADNVKAGLGQLENPTEGVLKLMTYVPRMEWELNEFKQKWGSKPSPITIGDVQDTLNVIRQISNSDPGQKILSTTFLNKISDPVKRAFLTDAMSVFYPDVRLQTGAAIAAAEWLTAFEQMVPYADDEDGGEKKRRRMEQYFLNHKDSLEATPAGRRFMARREARKELGGKDPKPVVSEDAQRKALGEAAIEARSKGPEAWAAFWKSLTPAQRAQFKKGG